MIDLWTALLGPLAGPECVRASRRGWIIWVRLLPGLVASATAFVAIWAWWMGQQIDPLHRPVVEIRVGLWTVEAMMVAIALILTPALLAGTLAGEKERGSIGLLLTTRVNAAEIVLGRLAGRLSQVVLIELAAVPGLLLFGALAGYGWSTTAVLIVLPAAVSLGVAGLALAASSVSRRGRDALLLVYLLIVVGLMAPLLERRGGFPIGLVSPFDPLGELIELEDVVPALVTSAVWAILGGACLALAAWRLRPNCLAVGDSERVRKAGRWRGWVPPIDERPMLWKELYIERAGTLGRAGRWVGWSLIGWLGPGSLTLAAIAEWGDGSASEGDWPGWARSLLAGPMYGGSSLFLCFLIEWTIGLRAAVAIASERERGTWDALLTSPLEGGEIVRGKLWGSLHALRWLVGSTMVAWTVAALHGGLLPMEYAERMIELPVVGAFMAAVGVRTSLRAATATRAMSVTIGLWLVAYLGAKVIALLVCLLVGLLCLMGWLFAIQLGLETFQSRPWFPIGFEIGFEIVFIASFLLATILVVGETRLRFDRVAGRMAGGETAIAVDRFLHPLAPGPAAPGKAVKPAVASEV